MSYNEEATNNFIVASLHQNLRGVRRALRQGADPNATYGPDETTVAHMAAHLSRNPLTGRVMQNEIALLRMLDAAGADFTRRDRNGDTVPDAAMTNEARKFVVEAIARREWQAFEKEEGGKYPYFLARYNNALTANNSR